MTHFLKSQRSALALLVTRIRTDHTHDAVTPNDFAVAANTLNRCQHFHIQLLIIGFGTLHAFRQNYIYFAETLFGAEDDARTTQVVRCQLHRDLVTRQYADIVHTHLAGNKAEHNMTVFEHYPECRIREVLYNLSLHFNQVFFCHTILP